MSTACRALKRNVVDGKDELAGKKVNRYLRSQRRVDEHELRRDHIFERVTRIDPLCVR
jgi:hypothetical protein